MVQKDLEHLQSVLEVLAPPVPEYSLLLWLITCTLLICTILWLRPASSCRLLSSLPNLTHPHCTSDFVHAPGSSWLQGSAELQRACGWRHPAAKCSRAFWRATCCSLCPQLLLQHPFVMAGLALGHRGKQAMGRGEEREEGHLLILGAMP